MKKILAMAAVAALAAGASVYAANPFSDVSTSDWAYQAVADLSDQGVVEGYPDGTFKGENNITRYEMAQIIARLMAKEDQLNAEQRATVDKLAGEYADELDNLGVRVSNLEKKVGNIAWSGDARMRYTAKDDNNDAWDGRVQLALKATVNDNTTVNARFRSNLDFKSGADSDTYANVLNVTTQGKYASLKLGRYGLAIGNQDGWLYNGDKGVDGAELGLNLGPNVKAAVGFGELDMKTGSDRLLGNDRDVIYATANADLKVAGLNLAYLATKGSFDTKDKDNKVNGTYHKDVELAQAGLTVPVAGFNVFGEYTKNTLADEGGTAWNAGVSYGKLDLKKAGSFNLTAAYNDVEQNVYFGSTGWHNGMLDNAYDLLQETTAGKYADELTFWAVRGNVTLAENTFLHAEYAFAGDYKNASQGVDDPDDTYSVSLNYVF